MDSTDAPERAGASASAISGASTPKRLEEGPAQKNGPKPWVLPSLYNSHKMENPKKQLGVFYE